MEQSGEARDADLIDNPLIRRSAIERREYQLNIANTAIGHNTLVVLPTALGKTEIAILAAAHFLYNHWDKKVLVMAPTRPLVTQHHRRFMGVLRLRPERAAVLTGAVDAGCRMKRWMDSGTRLYFATPQVVVLDMERGLRLDGFSLVVFDEAHRARSKYAYTEIAKEYIRESPHPIVLGLTASPGATKERVMQICDALGIERIEARTENDADVRPYVHRIFMEWETVKLPPDYVSVRDELKRMELEKVSALKDVLRVPPSVAGRRHLIELQRRLMEDVKNDRTLWPTLIAVTEAIQVAHIREMVESQGKYATLALIERMKNSRKRTHASVLRELGASLFESRIAALGEHPKIPVLVRVVGDQLRSNPNSRVLVFCHYRDSIQHIVSALRREGFAAERFVGQAKRSDGAGMSQSEQMRTIDRLESGETQILVLSSVGEEGLNIPSADLVVFYEPVPSEIRHIQRRGRTGRVRIGRAVILVAEDTIDSAYMWGVLRKIKKMMGLIKELNDALPQIQRSPLVRCAMPPDELVP